MNTAKLLLRAALRATTAVLALTTVFSGLAMAQSSPQQSSPEANPVLDAYIDAIRADVRVNSVAMITNTMQFSEKDAAIFWPIYKKYQAEETLLNDEYASIIKAYAVKWDTMTDDDAKGLMKRWIDVEGRKIDLRRKYFVEFSKVFPGITVVRFFQLEHRLDLIVDLKIVSDLPMLGTRDADTNTGLLSQ